MAFQRVPEEEKFHSLEAGRPEGINRFWIFVLEIVLVNFGPQANSSLPHVFAIKFGWNTVMDIYLYFLCSCLVLNPVNWIPCGMQVLKYLPSDPL
jgi:hypothetical protein